MNRRYRNLLICLFSILLLGTYHSTLYWLDRPRTSLVFYNVRGCPAVHCIESDGRSWINYVDTISNEKRLKRMAANYWKHHHLLPPKEITADCRYMELNRQQQIISYHGCHICVINDNIRTCLSQAHILSSNRSILLFLVSHDRMISRCQILFLQFFKRLLA